MINPKHFFFKYIYFFIYCFILNCKSNNSENFALKIKQSSVSIYNKNSPTSAGSGVIIKKNLVVTCSHVVQGYHELISVLQNGKKYNAKILVDEPKFDLAILEVEGLKETDELEFNENIPQINSEVFLIGSAYGLDNTFLKGYVSAVNKNKVDINFPEIPFIQTFGLSFPGTSGAGVFNSESELIGINRATYGSAPGTSIGLVIPITFLKVLMEKHNL